jgi:hypothetical protein
MQTNTEWKPSKEFECFFKLEDGYLLHAEMNMDDSKGDTECQICESGFNDKEELQEYLDEATKVLGVKVTYDNVCHVPKKELSQVQKLSAEVLLNKSLELLRKVESEYNIDISEADKAIGEILKKDIWGWK